MGAADQYKCVIVLLGRLGRTSDEVASSLMHLGMRGTRRSARINPLSNYLATFVIYGDGIYITVGDCGSWVWIAIGRDPYRYFGGENQANPIPAASEFLNRFNAGQYNGLASFDDSPRGA